MNNLIKSADVTEAMEQVRASFTVSRMAFGAITLLYGLANKDEKWVKKFQRIQKEYHEFLLKSYTELESECDKLRVAEGAENKSED